MWRVIPIALPLILPGLIMEPNKGVRDTPSVTGTTSTSPIGPVLETSQCYMCAIAVCPAPEAVTRTSLSILEESAPWSPSSELPSRTILLIGLSWSSSSTPFESKERTTGIPFPAGNKRWPNTTGDVVDTSPRLVGGLPCTAITLTWKPDIRPGMEPTTETIESTPSFMVVTGLLLQGMGKSEAEILLIITPILRLAERFSPF